MPYSEMDPTTRSQLTLLSQRAREEPRLRFTSLARYLNEGFLAYLRHDPLPQPRIVHRLYPSPSGG